MTAQKSVLKLTVHEERIRKKVMRTVSRFPGVTSIAMDDKAGKMTVVGEVDVPRIVKKLRKICHADIVTVEAVKPPEKPKPDPKPKTDKIPTYPVPVPVPYWYYNPYECYVSYPDSYYYQPPCANYRVVEEPNTICVIM